MEEINAVLTSLNEAVSALENMRSTGDLLDEIQLAEAYSSRGMLNMNINMFEEAILDFDKCIEILERLASEEKFPNPILITTAYGGRGRVYHIFGEYGQALDDLNLSIDMLERLQELGKPFDEKVLLDTYLVRGSTLNYMLDYPDDSLSDYVKCAKLWYKLKSEGKSPDKADLAEAFMGLAQSFDQKQDYVAANNFYDKCIPLREQLIRENHPLVDEGSLITPYMNRGANYFALEKFEKAIADQNRCIELIEGLKKRGIPQDEYTATMCYFNRAISYYTDINTKTAAINDYKSALLVLKEVFVERPELQVFYYEILTALMESLSEIDDIEVFDDIIDEFLYPMCSVPKTDEALDMEAYILERLG